MSKLLGTGATGAVARGSIARFGPFHFDLKAGALSRDGVRVPLEDKCSRVLAILLENAGTLVTHQELREALWPSRINIDFEHALHKIVNKVRRALDDEAAAPTYIQTRSRRGYLFCAPVSLTPPSSLRRPAAVNPGGDVIMTRIAVLPYRNATGDPSVDSLADRLTEQTIDTLSILLRGNLGVIAFGAVLPYAGGSLPLGVIAQGLGADYMVCGQVRERDGQLRLRLELIDADETLIWSYTIASAGSSLTGFEGQLAHELRREIWAAMRQVPSRRTDKIPATDLRRLYAQGQYLWRLRTERALQQSIACYQLALKQTPDAPQLYIGLMLSYAALNSWCVMHPKEAQRLADAAARQASLLDPSSGKPHVGLAYSRLILADDWSGAERELAASMAASPDYSVAPYTAAYLHTKRGDFASAVACSTRALALEPQSAAYNANRAYLMLCAGDLDAATRLGRQTLALHPDQLQCLGQLAVICAEAGLFDEACRLMERGVALSDGMAIFRAHLAHIYAVSGRRDESLRLLHGLEQEAARRYVCGTWMSMAYAALGMPDSSLAWLVRAFEDRDPNAADAIGDPRFDPLRADHRFQDILLLIKDWVAFEPAACG